MRHHDRSEEVDVVVVGTGAGGAPLIASLAARGLRVVALEAGANSEPGEHTADELEGSDINWMDERLSGGGTPTAFGPNNSGRGVGGSTLHWGAFSPAPMPATCACAAPRARASTGPSIRPSSPATSSASRTSSAWPARRTTRGTRRGGTGWPRPRATPPPTP
ncbi:hypothetical protein GCM10025874_04220 [Arenivirga flava]|uniref:Glucose-methanol-choline oxidoreductase N-terminal domain-containing protein n=2 Tax=Arenivirga flava TaxID=1930060 RepID=A0AA37UDE2_9MICO|nr:hypothetical protein GCM10025874_04220 [Arenivirga flava]